MRLEYQGFLLLTILLTFFVMARADELPYISIESEVEKILLKRNIKTVADEFARNEPGSLEGWLKAISIYGRAGHSARILQALKRYPEIGDRETSRFHSQTVNVARKAIAHDDLATRKVFYEVVAPLGDGYEHDFIKLWKDTGDLAGLEKWLAPRAGSNETWFRHWIEVGRELGTSGPIFQKLEDDVRADPGNWEKVKRYYDYAQGSRDMTWLAESPAADSAFGAYRLGTFLDTPDKALKIGLFKKSLSLPFTAKDLADYASQTHYAMAPVKPIDPEKQVRFQAKKALAEAYMASGQPQFAQPIAEELTTMDMSGIHPDDVFRLAGSVQLASGQRVVESKILQEERQNENSVEYWIERANYYQGRNEKELVWNTCVQALAKFGYVPGDTKASYSRLRILEGIGSFRRSDHRNEARAIFRRELANPDREGWYIRELALIMDDIFEDVRDEFFVNTDLAPKIMASEARWHERTAYFIREIMESESWIPEKRVAVWDQMAALARKDVLNRAEILAVVMADAGEHLRAVPLLEAYIRAVPPAEREESFAYGEAMNYLFEAYTETGAWQKAEKMYIDGHRWGGDELGSIAVSAANAGKFAEVLRLWKMNANLDRRKIGGLVKLAKTSLKPMLRQFYRDMKSADPFTDVPDRALALLK